MSAHGAHRIAVPAADSPRQTGCDYVDSFEVAVPASDDRSPEEFMRAAIDGAGPVIRSTIRLVHRHVLRLQLHRSPSPDTLMGWTITTSQPDLVRLEARSSLLGRATLVGCRTGPRTQALTTRLSYEHRSIAKAVWTLVGPLHRAIAPHLMDRAAAAGPAARAPHPGRVAS